MKDFDEDPVGAIWLFWEIMRGAAARRLARVTGLRAFELMADRCHYRAEQALRCTSTPDGLDRAVRNLGLRV